MTNIDSKRVKYFACSDLDYHLDCVRATEGCGHPSAAGGRVGRGVGRAGGEAPGAGVGGGEAGGIFRHGDDDDDVSRLEDD